MKPDTTAVTKEAPKRSATACCSPLGDLDYRSMVEELTEQCNCADKPCDSLLAGSICDTPYAQDEPWCNTCANLGILNCHCGGDLCICKNNGEYDCPDCTY